MICQQVIQDRSTRWGQITCLKWTGSELADQNKTICFGTGRGMVLIYRRLRSGVRSVNMTAHIPNGWIQSQLLELSNTCVVSACDSIESLAHDHIHNRLAVTTHYGEIKLYTVEKSGEYLIRHDEHN
jgi:hypothetical protein